MNLLRDFVDSLRCQLCSKVLHNPSTFGTCGHTFCLKCVISTLEGVGISTSQCPSCKQPGWKKDLKPNYQVKNAVEHVGHLLTTLCRTQKGAFGSVAEGGNTVNELPHRVAPQKGFGDAENQKEEEVTCIPTLSEICLEQLCPEILCTNSKGCCPGDVRQAGDLPYHVASLKEEVALLEAAIQLCDEMPINTKLQVFGSNEIAGPTPNDANHGLQRALTREKTQSTLHKRERCWEEGTIVVEKREGASRSQAKRRHLSNQFIFGQNKTIQVTEQIACEQETSRSQSLSFPLQDEAMQTLQTIPSSLPFEEGKLENTIVIPDSQETFLPQSQSLMPHSEMQPKAIDRVQMQVPLHRPSTKRAMDGTRYRTQGFSVSQGKRSLKTPNNKAKDIRALLETHQAAQSAMRSKALYMVMDVDTLDDELAAVVSAFKRSNPLANFSSEVTEQTTHVVVQTDSRLIAQKWGIKYLQGLASGCWIVSPAWLEACVEAHTRVHERHFEVQGCIVRTPNLQSRALKAPERARNLLAKGEQLLSGRTMFVSSTLDADLLTQLQRVVSLAGGTALLMNSTAAALNDPTTSGDLILLTDDAEEAKRYLQFGFQNVLNTSWLMDSVAVVSCLDTEQYRWRADLDSKRFEMATSV